METAKNEVSSSSSSIGMQSVSVGFICICRGENMGIPLLRDKEIEEMTEVGSQGLGRVSIDQLRVPFYQECILQRRGKTM